MKKTLLAFAILLGIGAPAFAGLQADTYAIQKPFSYFAFKGNLGLSSAEGGSLAYGGSLGWVTNGFAIWFSGNAFDYSNAYTSGYLSGGEVEVEPDFDFETDYYRNGRYVGSRMSAFYIPLILGDYGEDVQNGTFGPQAVKLEPAIGFGIGIRGTGGQFMGGGFFWDLNVIYRYAIHDTDPGAIVLNDITGTTGAAAIGLWFQ